MMQNESNSEQKITLSAAELSQIVQNSIRQALQEQSSPMPAAQTPPPPVQDAQFDLDGEAYKAYAAFKLAQEKKEKRMLLLQSAKGSILKYKSSLLTVSGFVAALYIGYTMGSVGKLDSNSFGSPKSDKVGSALIEKAQPKEEIIASSKPPVVTEQESAIPMYGTMSPKTFKDIFQFSSPAVAGGEKRHIAVLSDPECPACKALDVTLSSMIDAKKLQVTYIPVPIRGEASAIELTQLICEANPLQAWKKIMSGGVLSTPNKSEAEQNKIRACAKSAIASAEAFKTAGLAGTPTIMNTDGKFVTGTATEQQLLDWLDGKIELGKDKVKTE